MNPNSSFKLGHSVICLISIILKLFLNRFFRKFAQIYQADQFFNIILKGVTVGKSGADPGLIIRYFIQIPVQDSRRLLPRRKPTPGVHAGSSSRNRVRTHSSINMSKQTEEKIALINTILTHHPVDYIIGQSKRPQNVWNDALRLMH